MKKQLIILLAFMVTCLYGQQLNQVEYFFDEDPGFGLATPISINPSEDVEIIESLDISNLLPGFHSLFVRIKSENGSWSSVLSKGFYIEANKGEASLISEVEYFYDQDPGYGNGFPFLEFQHHNELQLSFLAGVSQLEPGTHEFNIRTMNDLNQWSQTFSQQFDLLNCDLSISGFIFDADETPIPSGMLVLYQYFGEGSAVGVDTLYLEDGNYEFSQVCPNSNYFIKIIPEDNNSFLPTYYGDTPYWQEAAIISTQQSSLLNMNIMVSSFSEMDAGTSQVKGHIYHAESRGEPVKNVDVILEFDAADDKGNFLPVAYNRSNDIGEWSMSNLPIGNFRIKVEIPGLEMDTTYYIQIAEDNTTVEDLNFYVDFNTGIFVAHIGVSELNMESSIQIFPNPTLGTNLWIQSVNPELKIVELIIYNYAGQTQDLNNGLHTKNAIDISELSKGFYLLRIKTNKGIMVRKIIIQ
ncbi:MULTISPECIES: T9SS type A sorting domain-containing protein [unclassified Lentimicrobium]|uniref:T9SS type A sorting domain-containing protein n=1 Tax=unclassified Lentimicrobium TaxID=2677434 RepID=UPI001552CC33|nr:MULTISPECIES: T9SS type A sorting domain-containing protein [unclassified Lentimicrobium]NPD46420.1 T9SS type A sorting domain-containing protein [Lentimicrobium sp. S6]NPD84939.1 T9SS type A sorting domain-containing protein [Lentimicrobium sp. L6]